MHLFVDFSTSKTDKITLQISVSYQQTLQISITHTFTNPLWMTVIMVGNFLHLVRCNFLVKITAFLYVMPGSLVGMY